MFTAWSEIKFLASKAFVQSLNLITTKHCEAMAVVVAQLAEWSVHTTRDLQFESSHQQFLSKFIYCQLYLKDKNKEKRGREWPIKKI